MTRVLLFVQEALKSVVAVVGLAATLSADGLLPPQYGHIVAVAAAVLTALGVYHAENAEPAEDVVPDTGVPDVVPVPPAV